MSPLKAAVNPKPFHFSVTAVPEPGALIRILALFAKRGAIVERCHAALERAERDRLIVDLQVEGISGDVADRIGEGLRSLVSVELVLLARS